MAIDWGKIIAGGAAVAGPAISAYGASKQRGQDLKLTREQLAQQAARTGLDATQMDPFAQQKQRQKQALVAQLMGNFSPSSYGEGKFSGGLGAAMAPSFAGASSFFGPNAMAGAESAFHKTALAASPTYAAPGRETVGYAPSAGYAPGGSGTGVPGAGGASPGADLVAQVLAARGQQGAPGKLGGAFGGGLSGARAGMQFGGPIGAAVGGIGGALAGAIRGNVNSTRGAREKFGQSLGYSNLDALAQALSALGPQGEEMNRIAGSVIGKKDTGQNQAWMNAVAQMLKGGGGGRSGF